MTPVRTTALAAAGRDPVRDRHGLRHGARGQCRGAPGTYTVTNAGSGKCVDARSAATANGTAVQQYTCNGTAAQQWTFTATDAGYYQVGATTAHRPGLGRRRRVDRRPAADPPVDLRRRRQPAVAAGRRGQRQLPLRQPQQRHVPRRAERVHGRQRAAAAVHLQRHRRAVVHAQRSAAAADHAAAARHPGLRPERHGLRPVDVGSRRSRASINSVYNQQQSDQFGTGRYALLFKPGTYNVDVHVGFYTAGRGPRPVAGRRVTSTAAACTWTPTGSAATRP